MSGNKLRGRLVLRSVPPTDGPFLAALAEAGLTGEALDDPNGANFVFARKSGEPVAYGGYDVMGDIALLRSVTVLPAWRGQRLGGRFVAALISQLQGINIREVYLLTETAELFFAGLGFDAIGRDEAPEAIRASAQFSQLCPDAAILMHRLLDEMMRLKLDEIHPQGRQ